MKMPHLPSCLKGPLSSPLLLECEYQFYLKGDQIPCLSVFEFRREYSYTHGLDHRNSHKGKDAEHFIEKFKSLYPLSRKINSKLLADPTYPIKPKTFGKKLGKKRMDLGLQIKELAEYLGVTRDTIINWELRNVKPINKNLTMVKRFLELQQTKRWSQDLSIWFWR